MTSQDAKLAVALAIAATSRLVKVRKTKQGFTTSPPNLFSLKLNDEKVGITAKQISLLKEHLQRLLPELESRIARLPNRASLPIREIVRLMARPTRPLPARLKYAKKKGGGGPPKRRAKAKATVKKKAKPKKKPLLRFRYGIGPPTGEGGGGGGAPRPRPPKKAPKKRGGGGGGGTWYKAEAKAKKKSPAKDGGGAAASRIRPTPKPAGPPTPPWGPVPKMEDWPIAAGGEGPPIPFDLGEDVSYDVVGTKAAYQDTAAPKRRRSAVSRDKRVVNTGFARPQTASRPLPNSQPLYASQKYYFWVEVGTEVEGSIEVEPTSLPEEHLPPEAKLTVALFDFNEGLKITPGADVGEIQLPPEGRAIVIRQPGSSKEIRAGAAMLQQRLFFPVRTLEKAGRFRLRCNIYYEQILVQSRLIEVKVDLSPGRSYQRALRSKVDYTLSRSLSPATLTGMEPHRLSLFINDNGNGTHGFRFFGEKQFKGDASFDGQEIQNWITLAREALRQASWGDKEPWNSSPKRSYLYTGARNLERLKSDLVRFAIWGYTFYDAIIERLTGSVDESDELAELMKTPGMIQIALKQSARHVLPAAMIYDYGLETNASSYSLCPAFLQSIDAAVPLEQSSCFKGLCPSRNGSDDTVVCPSGFWGFRHSLGMPLSLKSTGELPSQIFWDERPELTVGVSTDKAFTLRTKHEQVLQSLRQGLGWNYADTRDAVLKLLREKSSHLVYFYCHGGMSGTVPFIQVGPATEKGITRDNLRHEKIRWKSPRPLVFINGCHTAALEPDVAMEFISAFVNVAGASGVIGTEITIFEQLARPFAEECLRNFLEGAQIGDAVRRARLKLLKDGNPLGLVYIPYVIASLSMVQKQPTK